MQLIDTPLGTVQKHGSGAVNIVLSHGSGVGMNHEFMQMVARTMAIKNFTVYLFEFSYMQQIQSSGIRRPPPAVAKLQLELIALLSYLNLPQPLVIGGKSLGSRIASLVVEQTSALGWFALGYPFHPSKKPQTLRVEHLLKSNKPGLIIQGTRDALGSYDEVKNYRLPNHIELSWLPDMDHSFKPYKASPYSQEQAIERAILDIEQWLQGTLKCTVVDH
ncbi:MAG: alpha/beta hydrolase [Gammaproteobacteria bacterium]|nr:alpha/beta hydrolase [Gammaproteobacteria bacterium]